MGKYKFWWEYPISGNIKRHAARGVGPATDYETPMGTIIHSPIRGTITVGWSADRGNWINITKPGLRIELSHLSSYIKTSGTSAWRSAIGRSGNTGKVTGPHVHAVAFILDKKTGRVIERLSFLGWQLRHAYNGDAKRLPANARKFLKIK